MKLDSFTPGQRHAVLDLALLAMYADGRLTSAEDQRVQLLLAALGYGSEYEAAREYDDAVGRISRHAGSADSALTHAKALAQSFTTPAERQSVTSVLDRLVESDRHIAAAETDLLAAIREALGGGKPPGRLLQQADLFQRFGDQLTRLGGDGHEG